MTNLAASAPTSSMQVDGTARAVAVAVLLPLVYLLFGVSWIGYVPVLPEVAASVGKPVPDAAFLVVVISWAKSFVPILAGLVAARIGLTTTMRIGGVLIVLGGLAPWLHDYAAAVAVRFLFGVGGAVWVTLMGPIVLALLTPSQRPLANAVNGVAVNAGIVVAYSVMLPLAKLVGFQWALSAATVVTGVCLVALTVVGKLGDVPAGTSVSSTLSAYGKTLALPVTWILAVAFCGPLALYLMLNTFLSGFLVDTFHVDRSAASHWMIWLNIWGVPMSLASGVILAKIKTPRPLLASVLLVPVGLYTALHASDDSTRAIAFVLVSMGLFLPVSPLVTTVQKMPGQSPQSFGMIIGTMFAVSYVVSSAIPSAVAPLVAHGVPLDAILTAAGLLGLTPLAGLLLTTRKQ